MNTPPKPPRRRLALLLLAAASTAIACGRDGRRPETPGPSARATVGGAATTDIEFTSAEEIVAPGTVSSEFGEVRLAASPDAQTLLWGSTDRPGGPGGWNVWLSRRAAGGWARAEPLPGAINTPDDEFGATFLHDGASFAFSRSRDANEHPIALFFAARGPAGYGAGAPLGPAVNVAGGWTLAPALDWRDRSRLCLSGRRPEAGVGKLDLCQIRDRLR